MSYYDRKPVTMLDGTLIFSEPQDRANEREVADIIEAAFQCKMHPFGLLSAIDWWAERHGRMVGLLELKSRTHDSQKYGTVYLNVRKWLALSLGSIGLGVPSTFVVRFTDTVKFIHLKDIEASTVSIAGMGQKRVVSFESDVEPIIEVPIASMKTLKGATI